MNRHDKANQDIRLKLIMILIITKCIPTLLLFLQNNVKSISQEKEISWSPLPTLSYTHAFSFPCRPSLLHLIQFITGNLSADIRALTRSVKLIFISFIRFFLFPLFSYLFPYFFQQFKYQTILYRPCHKTPTLVGNM